MHRVFLFLFIYFYSLHTVYPHWNGKVKRKIEIIYAFFTPRIFHTPHFPHPAFSTFCTPRFPPNRKVENQLIKSEQLTVTVCTENRRNCSSPQLVIKVEWPQSDNKTLPCNDKTKLRRVHLCLRFKIFLDFKGGSFTASTQTYIVSGAII